MKPHRAWWAVLVAVVLLAAAPSRARQGTQAEEAARLRYASGVKFMAAGQYDEALKDFRAIVETWPATAVADDALLQTALYALDVAHDPDAAQAAAETLIRTYGDQDAAPMAHVVLARAALARGRTPEHVEAALASFERVVTLFPGDTESVPAALHGAADTLRMAGRWDEAVEKYEQVSTGYPRSRWAARAALGLARIFARSGEAVRVLADLQRVRLRFPGTPESEQALDYSSILYRLGVLARQGRPAFQFVPPPQPGPPELRRVTALGIGPRDALYAVTGDGVLVLDAAGAATDTLTAANARGVIFDLSGQAAVVRRDGLQVGPGAPVRVMAAGAEAPRALDDIAAAVVTSAGDLLVADGKQKTIVRDTGVAWRLDGGSAEGRMAPATLFARVEAARLAVNSLDGVAALDEGARSIVILDRDGQPAGRIAQRGPGYELRDPVDLAYDPLDHLYVLDRDTGSVVVFGAALDLITTFTLPETAPGAFRRARAFAIDAAGRLHIYDDRMQRIQVYR